MITLTANIIAITLYVFISFYCIKHLVTQQLIPRQTLLLLMSAALLLHGIGICGLAVNYGGIQLGFFSVSSLLFWVINLTVLLSSLKKALHNLFVLLAPLASLAIAASLTGSRFETHMLLDYQLASHIIPSILAYSLLTIATLQALFLAYQNHQLKNKRTTGTIRLLPPLQTMETLLFELLWAGEILLTLSLLSGFWFIDDFFGQHLVHKTAFSLIAWVIYAMLLWGRHQLGWRGYTAIRWTLVGFASLMLSYFGSKLVLEIILQRI